MTTPPMDPFNSCSPEYYAQKKSAIWRSISVNVL